ncbi:hypothetical protein V7O66_09040 [Methanolobus sp. ZRKC3]|uniref:hypothetical protein n=1 Tax=Methanolobus sp. ZRKC3 TaxID=3125786 RepID=UPI0032534EBB
MRNPYRLTTLGRALDIKHSGTRKIIVFTLLAGIFSMLLQFTSETTLQTSLLLSFKAAMMVFLVWAIARELDPDHDNSSFVAVVFTIFNILFLGIQPLIPLLWILLLLRIMNRSVGMRAGIIDSFIIFILGILLSLQYNWIFAMLTALVLILDSRLSEAHRLHLPLGIILAGISTYLFSTAGGRIDLEISLFEMISFIVAVILFLPVIIDSGKITSVGDRTGEKLDPTRVRMAQIVTLGIAFLLSIDSIYGQNYPILYGIMAGIGIYRMLSNKKINEKTDSNFTE